jgi:hypothetical protein
VLIRQPRKQRGKLNKAKEVGGCLFVSGRDMSKMLESVHKSFHVIPPPILPFQQASGELRRFTKG